MTAASIKTVKTNANTACNYNKAWELDLKNVNHDPAYYPRSNGHRLLVLTERLLCQEGGVVLRHLEAQ